MQQVPEPKVRPDTPLQLVLVADPDAVRNGLGRMLALPPLVGLTPDGRGTAELVLAEVLNNVAEHAYATGLGTVEVTLTPVDTGVACLIVDRGAPMPGGALPSGCLPGGPDTALEDQPEGGFGWHLIRMLTKDLKYVRVNGHNRLSFTLPSDS